LARRLLSIRQPLQLEALGSFFPTYCYLLRILLLGNGWLLVILLNLYLLLLNMLITASGFSVLLQTLGLTQGLSKPTPDSATKSPAILSSDRGTDDYSSAALPHFQALSNLPGQHLAPSKPASAQSLDQTDGSCNVNPYTAPAPLDDAFPPFDQAEANVYRYRQQQSVNLGSWSASCLNHARDYSRPCLLGLYTSHG
jgi:hypothetical protein